MAARRDLEPPGRGATARKQVLRHQMQRRLAALPAADRAAWSSAIAERALALPEIAGAAGVLTCLSFGTEVDTGPLLDRLVADRRVYVPRAEAGSRRLYVHPYPCALETLSFGLRQPPASAPALADEEVDRAVDVVLVLGLAFDAEGYRLGHGAGYFDRFLAGRPFPAVGLAYSTQRLHRLPREPHDVPMAALVTERETTYTPASSSWRANIPGV